MGAVAPAVSVGLSAASTISSISAQKQKAEARRKQLEQKNMLAQEQLELSQEQFEQNKELARKQHEREQLLIDAQEKQAYQQQQATEIKQRTALLQTELQARQMQEQAEQRAMNILGQAENAGTQSARGSQALNEQGQQIAEQQGRTTDKQRQARDTSRQRDAADSSQRTAQTGEVNPEAVRQRQAYGEAQKRVSENVANLQSVQNERDRFAQNRAGLTRDTAELTSGFLSGQIDRQERAQEIQSNLNRNNIEMQSKRNKMASESAFYANQAASSMQQQSRAIQTQAGMQQRQAQMDAIQGPGLGAVAQGAANMVNTATKTGLLGPDTTLDRTNPYPPSPEVTPSGMDFAIPSKQGDSPQSFLNADSYSTSSNTQVTNLLSGNY